jgi:glycogen phosphorylase
MPVFFRSLPNSLSALHKLANNLHWSWNHGGDLLWRRINPAVWEQTQNPMSVLQLTSDQQFMALENDADFITQLNQLEQAQQTYLTQPNWFSQYALQETAKHKPLKGIAYFSMEFGLCEALPLYAGGLGILAGDYLKTASDLGVPLIGIGLLYQEGYFHQSFSENGWQKETYLYNDPGSLPVEPVRDKDGSWLQIDTQFLCREVRFRVWQAQVGRVTLYLLDSNDPCNQMRDRTITSALYGGNTELRLMQELTLGICGWRLIEALDLNIDICHLNEGHAAFATLERISAYRKKHKVNFEQALWATRAGNIFTTHTAVAAAFDRYPETLLRPYIAEIAANLDVTIEAIIALGHAPHENISLKPDSFGNHASLERHDSIFNMAYLAMHTCAHSNGVSQLHETISKHMFRPLFPRWPEWEIPVSHVTNGVHIPTWDSRWADEEWTTLCGKERWRCDLNALPVAPLRELSDARLWEMATQERSQLVEYVRQRLTRQWRSELVPLAHAPLSCAITQTLPLDPNILTLGFARRFTEYKRSDLLLHDPERLARLLCNNQYPVQLIIAGKAHPADEFGKQALQRWYQFVQREDVREHSVLIEDYDIALAQQLVQGVDVWINTPRRPWEACGTSGMKVLVNGGLNLSTLDGWWAEAYQSGHGWAIGNNEIGHGGSHHNQTPEQNQKNDAQDAEALYQLLENNIVPLFYQRNELGLPTQWLSTIRTSMEKLTPRFSSNRMLQEYLENFYFPAAVNLEARQINDNTLATELVLWHEHLHKHWHEIHTRESHISEQTDHWLAEVTVFLGGIKPNMIAVQMIADASSTQPVQVVQFNLLHKIEGSINAYRYRGQLPKSRAVHDFTLRVISAHNHVEVPAENTLIYWQPRN